MHQPCYQDPQTGSHWLPWVRLHALRHYFDMVARLENFPNLRCNVNVVPSLLMQLDDCQQTTVEDRFLALAARPAADLTPADKAFLLEEFFSLNRERMVKPLPRYRELLQARNSAARGEGIWDISRFSECDYRDLQTWFYLAWSGESLQQEPMVRYLVSKGRDFTETDKQELFHLQRSFISRIVPLYRRLHDSHRIELSCSPLYHPILPLLCDFRSAQAASPDVPLPNVMFRHPEDAEFQVREAIRYTTERLGIRPRGMWPSEGALSPQVVAHMIRAGLEWTASDEIMLRRSGGDTAQARHFFPYRVGQGDGAISIFFRDRTLSDLIGFTYSHWPEKDAAGDLMNRLMGIAATAEPEAVVSIMLDGENAWEYYPEHAHVFWDTLFTLLDRQTEIRPVTFSHYLAEHPARLELEELHTGSWIQGELRTWIGHPEKNRAWELLAETRETAAARTCPASHPEVWNQIYIAQGSDWFWWYGDDHYSAHRRDFDLLFRKRLQAAYEKMGIPVPEVLHQPILETQDFNAIEPPVAEIHPTLDGRVSDYFEWLGAGRITGAVVSGAMHPSHSILRQVLFGFNQQNLCLRMDLTNAAELKRGEGRWKIEISFQRPAVLSVEISNQADLFSAWLICGDRREPLSMFALQHIAEVAVPMKTLAATRDNQIQWFIQVWKNGRPVERWPRTGTFSLGMGPDREHRAWMV
ncbi:MAG: hypothetical protein HY315_04125 [Acidobacteria bacterium]|nr:hypothetical protein [Acidobacteriota bacterium]